MVEEERIMMDVLYHKNNKQNNIKMKKWNGERERKKSKIFMYDCIQEIKLKIKKK